MGTTSAKDIYQGTRLAWLSRRGHVAFGDIDGQRYLITATKLVREMSHDLPPGSVIDRRDNGALLIQCGDGPLEILEWQPIPDARSN